MLNRPRAERAREFRYRFAQAMVFGLPAIALERFGRNLGGVEADRWVGLLQALLAGWVMYVGTTGLLFEGVVRLLARRSPTIDGVVATISLAIYCLSAIRAAEALLGYPSHGPFRFNLAVALIALWSACRWAMLRERAYFGAGK